MEIISSMLTSLGLGIGAGVNAYATFLVFGILGRFMPNLFEGDLASFFASTPVLIFFGVMYMIEFVADKVPAIDHAWDVIHTFIRPLAGGVVALAAANPEMPKGLMVVAAVLSGGAAFGSHVAKASLRAGSTATTGGTANPFLSILEDLFVVVNSAVAIFLPLLVVLLAVIVFVPAYLLLRRMMRRRQGTAAAS
jgi:hypothetical protein